MKSEEDRHTIEVKVRFSRKQLERAKRVEEENTQILILRRQEVPKIC